MQKLLSSFLVILIGFSLLGCKSSGEMRLHGKMTTIEHMDGVCWIFVDDKNRKYEVVTPSGQILKEGLQMSIKAVEVSTRTYCGLPTVIEVIEFRPDFEKDTY